MNLSSWLLRRVRSPVRWTVKKSLQARFAALKMWPLKLEVDDLIFYAFCKYGEARLYG
jgi:hypothetical protein